MSINGRYPGRLTCECGERLESGECPKCDARRLRRPHMDRRATEGVLAAREREGNARIGLSTLIRRCKAP